MILSLLEMCLLNSKHRRTQSLFHRTTVRICFLFEGVSRLYLKKNLLTQSHHWLYWNDLRNIFWIRVQFGGGCLCLVHYYISGLAGLGILPLNITYPIVQWDYKRIMFRGVLIQALLLEIISSCLVIKLWPLGIIQLQCDYMS